MSNSRPFGRGKLFRSKLFQRPNTFEEVHAIPPVNCVDQPEIWPVPDLSDVKIIDSEGKRKLVFTFENSTSVEETRLAFSRLVLRMLEESSLDQDKRRN